MTKKDFVMNVTEQLLANPRKVLAGHGISAAVLQQVLKRPDVMAKLASILYSLKAAKKGAVGLKKTNNLQIKGYKNFPEMNMKAREDIETFISGLTTEDASKFNNADNVITIYMMPDTKALVTGPEGDDVVEAIVTGKSVMLPFDTAVRKEYKIPGGVYVVIMVGDSAVRPAEEKLSMRMSKKRAIKAKKRTPAKVKAALKAKANKKLAILKHKRAALQDEAYNTRMQMQQSAYLQNALDDEDVMYGIGKNNMRANNWQINRAGILAGLSAEDKAIYATAQKLLKKGNKAAAKAVLKTMSNPLMVETLMGNAPTSGDAIVDSRKAAIRKQINNLRHRNEQLLLDLSLAPVQKRLSIKSMISKNNSQIKALRAKLGTYRDMNTVSSKNKAAILQKVNAAIEANIAEGNSITQALNAALVKIDATPQQKQVIKQQVIEDVAEGMPMQYAVQQAVQQNIQAENAALNDMEDDDLDVNPGLMTGNFDLETLLEML